MKMKNLITMTKRLRRLVLKRQTKIRRYLEVSRLTYILRRASKRAEAAGMKWLRMKNLIIMI